MAQPGLFLVHSKITAPDLLTPEQFLKWYDEAHIPDCLTMSGIHSAFRYRAAPLASRPDKPHLVIHPLQDVDFPRSRALTDHAATTSHLLPGPGGFVDDVAAFDMRAYGLVVSGRDSRRAGYFRGGRALALVVFDSALDSPTEEELMSEGALEEEVEPARSVLYQLHFAMPSPESNGQPAPRRVPEYAVLHELDASPEHVTPRHTHARVTVFQPIKAFGT